MARRKRDNFYRFCVNSVKFFFFLEVIFGFLYLPIPENWAFARHFLKEGCQTCIFGGLIFILFMVIAVLFGRKTMKGTNFYND